MDKKHKQSTGERAVAYAQRETPHLDSSWRERRARALDAGYCLLPGVYP